MNQHTLNSSYTFEGHGIHSGKRVSMTILPAPDDYGIVFQRLDKGDGKFIRACASNVAGSRRCTCLKEHGLAIMTPEHILAALAGLGVDNALIQVNAKEIPIKDGSSAVFAREIAVDGLREQESQRRYIVPTEKFEYRDSRSGSWLTIEPAEDTSFEVEIDFASPVVGVQRASFDSSVDFVKQIAPCRTFCFRTEVWKLRLLGLIKGGSLDNALVIDDVNNCYCGGRTPLFPNECARHKLLDLIGDFALAGAPVKGRITAYKPGHRFNARALQAFLETI